MPIPRVNEKKHGKRDQTNFCDTQTNLQQILHLQKYILKALYSSFNCRCWKHHFIKDKLRQTWIRYHRKTETAISSSGICSGMQKRSERKLISFPSWIYVPLIITFTIGLYEATKRILNQFPARLLRRLHNHCFSSPAARTEQCLVDRYGRSSTPLLLLWILNSLTRDVAGHQPPSPLGCGLNVPNDSFFLPTHCPRVSLRKVI